MTATFTYKPGEAGDISDFDYLFLDFAETKIEEHPALFHEFITLDAEGIARMYDFESAEHMFQAFGIPNNEMSFITIKLNAYESLFGGRPMEKVVEHYERWLDEKKG